MVSCFALGSILNPLHLQWWGDAETTTLSTRPPEGLVASTTQRDQPTPELRSQSHNSDDAKQVDADEILEQDDEDPSPNEDASVSVADESNPVPILPIQTNFSGIISRPFEPWTHPLPCFEPEENWKWQKVVNAPANRGFLFVKPYKTGSSTTSGINLRIARNVAIRQGANYEICKARFDHGPWFYPASLLFKNRNKAQSFLWTVIREPTKRAISQFFHMEVSRKNVEPRDAEFKHFLMDEMKKFMTDYYIHTLHTRTKFDRTKEDPIAAANAIMGEYDFIGITERMDESAVLLMMLLDLPMSDILYLSAKGKGGYDDGGGGKGCTYIWPSFVSPEMQEFFDTNEEWQSMVQYDVALYQAVNASMDLTIERLGRDRFETLLAQFRAAQAEAQAKCLPRTIFPCDTSGGRHKQTDCIWNDSGCGVDCLDKLAEELGLAHT